MARGVGSGLGDVRTVRVIAVLLYIEICMGLFMSHFCLAYSVELSCFME